MIIVLKSKLKEILSKLTNNIYELDNSYPYVSKDIIKNKVRFNWLEGLFYRAEVNDCDDYAIRQMSRLRKYGVGIALSSGHAFNLFVDNNKKIWLIEPQTGKIMDLDEIKSKKQYYPVILILI